MKEFVWNWKPIIEFENVSKVFEDKWNRCSKGISILNWKKESSIPCSVHLDQENQLSLISLPVFLDASSGDVYLDGERITDVPY